MGVTATVPEVWTAPIPWSMDADVPPVLAQERIVCCPGATAGGFAEKYEMTGALAGGAATAMLFVLVFDPPEFDAVSLTLNVPATVKTCVGFRDVEVPPSPKSQDQEVGLPVEVSVKKTVWPVCGDEGENVKSAAGAETALKVYWFGKA